MSGLKISCSAVLFDLDGVLIDSTSIIEASWRSWANCNGIDAMPLMNIIHGRKAIEVIREVAPKLDADAELAVLVKQELAGKPVVLGGVISILSNLNKRWGVVTSAPLTIALNRLKHVVAELPPVLVTADNVSKGKPAPDGYLLAANRLGVDPRKCVVVEDSQSGIEAALAAGMNVIGVGAFDVAAVDRATWRVQDLQDVSAIESIDAVELVVQTQSK